MPIETVMESQSKDVELFYDWQIPDGQKINANDYFMVSGIPKSFQAESDMGLNIDVMDMKGRIIANGHYNSHDKQIKFVFKNDLAAYQLKGRLTLKVNLTYNQDGRADFKINQKSYQLLDARYQQSNVPVKQELDNQRSYEQAPIIKSGRYDYDRQTKNLTHTWRIIINHTKLKGDEFVIHDTLPRYVNFDQASFNVHSGQLILNRDTDNHVYLGGFERRGSVQNQDISIQELQGRELVIRGKVPINNQNDYEICYTTSINGLDRNFKFLQQGNAIVVKNVAKLEDANQNILGEYTSNLSFAFTQKEMSDYIEPGTLEVIHKDQTKQKAVPGATFNLYDQNQKLVQANLKTDQNGKIEVPQVKPGSYTLKEIKAPENYLINPKIANKCIYALVL